MFLFKSGKNNEYVEIVDITDVYISKDGGVTFKKYRNLDGLRGIEERISQYTEWEIVSVWQVAETYDFVLVEDQHGDVFITQYPQVQGCMSKAEYDEFYGEYPE